MNGEIDCWLDSVSGAEWLWYVKVLSGNDTLLNGSHQAGPYAPRALFTQLFPDLMESRDLNPRQRFDVHIDSHGTKATATAIWYNNRVASDGTRNECRITNWGGRDSPLLDPEATGSLCVFAFHQELGRSADLCRVWLCRTLAEETRVLNRVGPVEPGAGVVYSPAAVRPAQPAVYERDRPCHLSREELPPGWLTTFPGAEAIIGLAVERLPTIEKLPADQRLIKRRACEYEIFLSVERAHVLPRVREGFTTVDLFVGYANAVTNRRKSRSGKSLELHVRQILREEGIHFSHGEESELGKRPDFLFPSAGLYRDPQWPGAKLRMLAVKTTCKDRWRQVLDEAERIDVKHLLTLQEGVSISQFSQMTAAGVRLVVPAPLHRTYHKQIRGNLVTLDGFLTETRKVCGA